MRHVWVILLLIAPAQAATWDDPTGDQQFTVRALGEANDWQDGGAEYDFFPYLDLVFVELGQETAEGWTLEIEVATLAAGQEPQSHTVVHYGVTFELRGQERRAFFEHDLITDETQFYNQWLVEYHRADGGTDTYWASERVAGGTREGLTFSAPILKSWFRNEDYTPMLKGEALEQVTPFAIGDGPQGCPGRTGIACLDGRDTAGPPQDVSVAATDPVAGHLAMFSRQPLRGSNGAATTYLYDVGIYNLGDQDDRVTIQVQAPSTWTVRSPTEVAAPAATASHFNIAVTVPFSHKHGQEETLEVRAVSGLDSALMASTKVGVIWHDPPQPGGHHPRISLHENNGRLYFDTQPQDSPAQAEPHLAKTSRDGVTANETYTWPYALQPSLLMGLDFQPGRVTGISHFTVPQDADVTVSARLMLSTQPPTIVAQETQTATWSTGSHEVAWNMPLSAGVDRVPLQPGVNLQLEFDLQYERLEPTGGTVRFLPNYPTMEVEGTWFTLPLQEFHDIIDADLMSSAARLSISAEDPERMANPGGAVLIEFDVANGASQAQSIDWSITGPNADWAHLLSGDSLKLGAGENATLQLVVAAPEDARDGDEAVLLLTGRERSTGAEIFGRALVTVTTTAEVVDQTPLIEALEPEGPKRTPALAVPLVLFALVVLARRR